MTWVIGCDIPRHVSMGVSVLPQQQYECKLQAGEIRRCYVSCVSFTYAAGVRCVVFVLRGSMLAGYAQDTIAFFILDRACRVVVACQTLLLDSPDVL